MGQPILQTAVLSEFGGSVSTGALELLSSGGQPIIGRAQAGAADLSLGHLYSFDLQPPVALLLSPSSSAQGMDQILPKGLVPIVATAGDLHFQGWTLEAAPGQEAQTGFMTLTASTAAANQAVIFQWNTTNLNGFFTLKLTALNAAHNIAVAKATVYIGEPLLLLSIKNQFDKPSGVAVDAAGYIYVANTGTNEVLKFNPQGFPAARFGRSQLDKPMGIALDAQANLYVADRNNHRIAVLNSPGTVIRSLGRTNPRGQFIPGKGEGEFNHPTGVAVSADRLAVADAKNKRVQIFDLNGNFLLLIKLSQVSSNRDEDEDDEDEDDDDDKEGLKLFGVALDPQNNVYVTDPGKNQVLAFNAQGQPLYAFGRKGKLLGQFKAPKGIVASQSNNLYVADSGNGRIQKIDPFQNPVTAFGSLHLDQPVGVGMDGLGNLYATDYKKNALYKFGVSGTTVAALARFDESDKKNKISEVSPLTLVDPAFIYRDLYAFPNPSRRNQNVTIRFQAGLSDGVEVQIYDVSGQLVHRADFGGSKVIDDGNGKGPQYTYDYVWDTSRIGSGVYLFLVSAHKAGERAIRKTGKVGVIR